MTTRSQQLRARDRKVLLWALFIAAAIHVAVFVLMPAFRATPVTGSDRDTTSAEAVVASPAIVSVVFGPPTILIGDSAEVTQPPDHTLRASRAVQLSTQCAWLANNLPSPLIARFRLRVAVTHEAKDVRLVETSGNVCADDALVDATRDLVYHWLPDARFRAPVQLVQPVALVGVQY